ncbi:MAG: hypothetical protein K8T20_00660 [Planctomycetes bacterium]|nr:hypothetical protein [Planctomycetota bacterium]
MLHRTIVLALVLLASCAAALRADISPEPLGGGVTPGPRGEKTDVAMTAEEVELGLSKDRLDVKVTFHLENLGAETSLQVGFPMTSIDELKDFKVEIDGKKEGPALVAAPPGKEPGGHDFSYWLAWEMKFAPAEKKTVVVSYNVSALERAFAVREESSSEWEEYLGGEDVETSLARRRTYYILETGAPWKGPIGKAVVRLKLEGGLTAANLRELSPPPTSRNAAGAEWSFTDLEPTENIEIAFCPATTLDREIEITRGVHGEAMSTWDRLCFHKHLADLLRLKGDGAGMRAAYDAMLDTIIAEQGEEPASDKPCTDEINEIATNLFSSPEALADPATAARAKKACDFLDRWIAAVGDDDEVLAALVKARKALGRDFRELVHILDWGGPEGRTMEMPDVSDAGKATLEEERVTITVGPAETIYDTTFILRGRRDGTAKVTLGGPLWPAEIELVTAAAGTFDNLSVTVDGAPVKVGPVACSIPNGPDDPPRAETRTGWTLALRAGQTIEVRVRVTVESSPDLSGYAWKSSPRTPPDDERRFDRRRATWTAAGTCWTTPRKLIVAVRLPDGVSPAHVRHLFPDTGKLDGSTARWTFDAVDTSGVHAETEVHVQWKGFTLDEEVAHLRKLLDSKPAGADIVRFQLALALRQAGRFEDEIAALDELIAANADPLSAGADQDQLKLDPGLTGTRPLPCYVFEARRKLGDDKATRAAAARAVEALKAKIADTHNPHEDKSPLWRELAEVERFLGNEAEAKQAEEQAGQR